MAKVFLFDFVDAISVSTIKDQISTLSPQEDIELHINSPGGDVMAGFALFNLLRSIPNKVITNIDGLAGSIASVVALAGDVVNISETGSIMIHNASVMRGGTAKELDKMETELLKIDKTILDIYVAKTRASQKSIRALMDAETILNAREAVKLGFADNIINPIKAVALINPNKINMNLLEQVKNQAKAFLGVDEKDEAVAKILAAADVVAEDEQKAKEDESSEAALLTADMVASTQYLADMKIFKSFIAATVEYMEAQPTEEQIDERIVNAVKMANEKMLKTLRSKTQVPRATNQPLVEEETKVNDERLPLFDKAFDKIKNETNKLYN